MKQQKTVNILVFVVVVVALLATLWGICSNQGPGTYQYESIRGQMITIYGKGIYQHMSREVAVQGIAQDYVTLFIGIPLLLVSLFLTGKNSLKARFILAGTLGYFLVTYLFYTAMAMYNEMFLGYVILLGASFFAFANTMFSFDLKQVPSCFTQSTPVKFVGGFLIFNSITIAFLWLSVVLPPLLKGTICPPEVEHYTTLIVQGFDLGLLLPIAFVSAVLFLKRKPFGYLLATVYMIFLSILMTALSGKIIAMASIGVNVFPAVIIIPLINLLAIICSALLIKNINTDVKNL
ncbi:MAG TPA: hypothetical protein ENO17_08500 [Candidatus Atribacteria bacterium]|nr:hypothetical protein [Candidatus Atribacteria bacterium]